MYWRRRTEDSGDVKWPALSLENLRHLGGDRKMNGRR
jgi:hypothetical protein